MGMQPVKLLGIGSIWNLTDNVCLSNQSEFSLTSTIETIEIPVGDTFQASTIPTLQKYSGRFAFRDINAAIIAAATAGTVANTTVLHYISREQVTIAAVTFQATLAEQPKVVSGMTYAAIEVIGADGRTYEQVATASAEDEFDDAGSLILQFHTTEADKVIYVSYAYEEASTGTKISADPTAVPALKTFMFAGKVYSTRLKDWKGYMVVIIKKLQRTGDMGIGTGVGDAATIGFDYAATVDVPEDLVIHLEQV